MNELFGRTPSKSVNPDEAVAMGAAIQVHLLTVVHAEIKVILCGLTEMVLRYSLNIFCDLVSCVFIIAAKVRLINRCVLSRIRNILAVNLECHLVTYLTSSSFSFIRWHDRMQANTCR